MRTGLKVVGKVYNVKFSIDNVYTKEVSAVCIGENQKGYPVYIALGEGYHRPIDDKPISIVEDLFADINLDEQYFPVFECNDEKRVHRVYLDYVDHAPKELYTVSDEQLERLRAYANSISLNFNLGSV